MRARQILRRHPAGAWLLLLGSLTAGWLGATGYAATGGSTRNRAIGQTLQAPLRRAVLGSAIGGLAPSSKAREGCARTASRRDQSWVCRRPCSARPRRRRKSDRRDPQCCRQTCRLGRPTSMPANGGETAKKKPGPLSDELPRTEHLPQPINGLRKSQTRRLRRLWVLMAIRIARAMTRTSQDTVNHPATQARHKLRRNNNGSVSGVLP
jgi:hypothetical protein